MLTPHQVDAVTKAEKALTEARLLSMGAVFGLRAAGLSIDYLDNTHIQNLIDTLNDALIAQRHAHLARRADKVAP